MKKKLISLAVAGALATPMVASAQGTNVTMFGSVQAEYATVNKDGQSSQAHIGDDTGVQNLAPKLLKNWVAD